MRYVDFDSRNNYGQYDPRLLPLSFNSLIARKLPERGIFPASIDQSFSFASTIKGTSIYVVDRQNHIIHARWAYWLIDGWSAYKDGKLITYNRCNMFSNLNEVDRALSFVYGYDFSLQPSEPLGFLE